MDVTDLQPNSPRATAHVDHGAPHGGQNPDDLDRPATVEYLKASDPLDWDAIDQESLVPWQDSIEMDVNARRAVFIGTKLSVQHIVEQLAQGRSETEVLASHPTLRPDHLRAALAYAADSIRCYTKALFDGRA